ncbi:MAG: hypothetical protein E5W19_21930 [Mesorhizobium sp.]|nr:MAG: hypothetical protein E5W19_21930 [Mesorhizobium sp.]
MWRRCVRGWASCSSAGHPSGWWSPLHFVIHGRSKERSDAAQTRGSMPGLQSVATVRNSVPLRPRLMSRHGS